MSAQVTTLREAFSLPDAGAPDPSPDRWQRLEGRLSQEVKTIKWPASMPDVAEKAFGLFDIKLPNIFWMSWRKADEVRWALAESKKTPEASKSLELADHVISSKHKPRIDVRIHNVTVKEIEFVVTLTFRLKGFVLVIKAGEIEEILTGRCEIEGKIQYQDLTIAEKKLSPINLPPLCKFKHEEMLSVYDTRPVAARPVASV